MLRRGKRIKCLPDVMYKGVELFRDLKEIAETPYRKPFI